jgi:hypothetical protein
MDTELISRTGINPYPSLADARAAVQISDFTHHKKRDAIWALNKFAEAVGAALEEIPADPLLISGRLNDITPGSIGLSRGGLNNLRSLLLSAISLVQRTSPGRHLNRLSPEWHGLGLVKSRSDRIALSRIAHFCSARGIGPNAVNDNTFAEFRNHLFRSLRRGPDSIYAREGLAQDTGQGRRLVADQHYRARSAQAFGIAVEFFFGAALRGFPKMGETPQRAR